MIEAYEIGIKLALQDGVSEGIAAIRRDLGSLDQAIAQTALRLGALQRIGAQALAASQGQAEQAVSGPLPRRPAAVTVPPLPREPETVVASPPVEMPPVGPARVPATRVSSSAPALLPSLQTAPGEAGSASLPVSPRPDVVVASAAVRRPVSVVQSAQGAIDPRPPGRLSAAPAPRATPSGEPVTSGPGVRPAPELRTVGFVAPAGERSRGQGLQPAVAGVVLPALASRTPAPSQAPAQPRDRETTRFPDTRTGEAREVRSRQPAVMPDMPALRMSPAQERPAALPQTIPAAAPRPAPSYAPPASSSRTREGSMRGDVFLDGARVGRWMSEQMARDAGRPNTGPTGFDPRRSAAWPGAAVTW